MKKKTPSPPFPALAVVPAFLSLKHPHFQIEAKFNTLISYKNNFPFILICYGCYCCNPKRQKYRTNQGKID